MKFTNKNNLPDYLYKLLSKDYKPVEGRLSVTQGISEPLPRNLKMKYYDKLVVDVADRLGMLIGNSLHHYLFNETTEDDEFAEVKLEDEMDGWTLVGKSDNYKESEETIRDFKTCKIWAWVYRNKEGSQIDKYTKQLNWYIWQWRRRGFEVSKAYLDLFFMDWSKRKASYEKDYPRCQYMSVEVPIWSFEEQEQYIREQVQYHAQAKFEECSLIEKWQDPPQFAVMTKGAKKAKACNKYVDGKKIPFTKEDAYKYIQLQTVSSKLYIEERPSECTKCLFFCDVAQVCPYANKK